MVPAISTHHGEIQAPVLKSGSIYCDALFCDSLDVDMLHLPTVFTDDEWPHLTRTSRKTWQRLQIINTSTTIEHAIQVWAGKGMASIGSDPGYDFTNEEEWQEGDCIEISLLRARLNSKFRVNFFVWNDIIEEYYPDGSPKRVTELASLPVFVAKNFGNVRGFSSDWRVVVPGESFEFQLTDTYYRFRV